MKLKKYVLFFMTYAVMFACPIRSFATTPTTYIGAEQITSAAASEEDLIRQYAEDLQKLENASEEYLTIEESEAGYQIIDGVKYAPEELEGDDSEEISEGVQPGERTGYVNVIVSAPEYIHEPLQVIVINNNTAQLFGCKVYELNGYCTQICLPAGNYSISSCSTLEDTINRYYSNLGQFTVKSGSQQDLIVEMVDSMPELEEAAYEGTVASTEAAEETTASRPVKTEKDTGNAATPETEEETSSVWLTVLLTILFTGIPAAGLGIYYHIKKKNDPFKGFDH